MARMLKQRRGRLEIRRRFAWLFDGLLGWRVYALLVTFVISAAAFHIAFVGGSLAILGWDNAVLFLDENISYWPWGYPLTFLLALVTVRARWTLR